MDWPARVIFRDAAAAILRRPVWTRPVMAAFELGKKKKNRNKKQNKTKKHRMRSKKRKSSHRPIEPSVGRRNPHLCRSQRNKRSKKATRSVAVVRRNEKWTKSAERKRDREREREREDCARSWEFRAGPSLETHCGGTVRIIVRSFHSCDRRQGHAGVVAFFVFFFLSRPSDGTLLPSVGFVRSPSCTGFY